MSTQMSIFKTGGGLPVHLQKKELSASTKALMGGATGKRISIRGGVFRMVINGQEVAVSQDRFMNVVVVLVAPNIARHYYKEVYQEGVNASPDCWSIDGETPDPHSEHLQSTACAVCPQNIAGSGQNDSRACRYLQRLAVVPEKNLEAGDIYELSLAATSLFGKGDNGKMPMQQYARFLGGHGVDIESVVTEIRFDLDSATPKLVFSAVRPLEIDELSWVEEYKESPEAQAAITFSAFTPPAKAVEPPKEPLYGRPRVIQEPEAPVIKEEPIPEPAKPTRARRRAPVPEQPEPVIAEPIKREAKPEPKPVTNIDSILAEWAED